MTPALHRALRIAPERGALVQDVSSDTPAERAGLRAYDVITRVDQVAIRSDDDLIRYISGRPPGSLAALEVWREGEVRTMSVKLTERPLAETTRSRSNRLQNVRPVTAREQGPLGFTVRDLDRATIMRQGLPETIEGVIVFDVDPAGPARLARIRAGHIVLEINRRRVTTAARVPRAGERAQARRGRRRAPLRQVLRPAPHHHHRRRSRIMKARILVVDDESAIRETMRMILEYEGHEVLTAGSGPEALTAAERDSPDLVFLDIKMPGIDGLEVLSRLRGLNEALPVVMVSAHGTASTALDAGRLGAFRFIEKPLSKDYVLDAVREGLDLGALKRENRQMRSEKEARHEMVGCSSTLKQILDQVRRAAPTTATVLILGRERRGQGVDRARDSPRRACARRNGSSRSTAPPFPRS